MPSTDSHIPRRPKHALKGTLSVGFAPVILVQIPLALSMVGVLPQYSSTGLPSAPRCMANVNVRALQQCRASVRQPFSSEQARQSPQGPRRQRSRVGRLAEAIERLQHGLPPGSGRCSFDSHVARSTPETAEATDAEGLLRSTLHGWPHVLPCHVCCWYLPGPCLTSKLVTPRSAEPGHNWVWTGRVHRCHLCSAGQPAAGCV